MVMNFFEHQEQSKRKTAMLVMLFALAVAGIVIAVYSVVISIYFSQSTDGQTDGSAFLWFDPDVFFAVTVGVLLVIIGGSLFKIIALKRGGSYIAESLGGRPVNPLTNDPDEKKFIHVVEEMAIAAGTPVPVAYVLGGEKGINAFAAGYTPDDAVVAVTDGCLRRLTRDELQGVVAHEFSHILNGDMRLNIRLIGMISGILILATIGRIALHSSSGSRKNGAPFVIIGLSFVLIGYIGVFVSRIIQSAVSRQREYLADASAVQFTRNPPGIAGALKKIGGFSKGSKIAAPQASETSHMFFSMAISSLFATHPPIKDRIQRIDPKFDGKFPPAIEETGPAARKKTSVMGFSDIGDSPAPTFDFEPEAVSRGAGSIDSDHVKHSLILLESIPPAIRKELNDPMGACAIVYSLLLDADAAEKTRQLESVKQVIPDEIVRHMSALDKTVQTIDPGLKLPLLDLSLPMLRRLSVEQLHTFKQAVTVLVESDGKLSLFEYALQLIIQSRLEAAFHPAAGKVKFKSIEPLIEDAGVLLSKLALEGHDDRATAEKAFVSAMSLMPGSRISSDGRSGSNELRENPFQMVGTAISRFAAAAPGVKKAILDACAHCILFDRRVTIKEAELLRAIAYALDLPVPPFLLKKVQRD